MVNSSGTIYCLRFGMLPGYCGKFRCPRCGRIEANKIVDRIVRGASLQAAIGNPVWFVTLYKTTEQTRAEWKQFYAWENTFNASLNRVQKALRNKSTREAPYKPEYVITTAYGKFMHRVHGWVHAHMLITWLPGDTRHAPLGEHEDHYISPFMDVIAARNGLQVWIEKPRSIRAVALYAGENVRSVAGKKLPPHKHAVKFSRFWDKQAPSF